MGQLSLPGGRDTRVDAGRGSMGVESVHDLAVDTARVRAALGGVPRVAYEAAHVYPLSAPAFIRRPGIRRERPPGGAARLYVHVPFCRYACTFCFYAKRVNTPRARMQRYVDAVRREVDELAEGTELRQIYVGGGTPTALPPDLLDELLGAVHGRVRLALTSSHTVEASPESLTAEHVDVLARRGVDRVSLGVQTLDESLLHSVNRRHSAQQAIDACALLTNSDMKVNVDLIYGFPGQREEDLRRDLETFAAFAPQSFTLYSLRLNEHTPLADVMEDVERVDLSALMRWRRFVELTMRELGYRQNRFHMFWRRDLEEPSHDRAPGTNAFGAGREIGIGVSAYSHVGETIFRNHCGFDAYLRRVEAAESPVEEVFPLGPRERRTLYLARTLGDMRELNRSEYHAAFGNDLDVDFGAVLDRFLAAGLLCETEGRITMSELGRSVYDLVTLAFYPEDARRWLLERQETTAQHPSA